jgi:aryl-alcohol dehydrogenase-like predicted oxidoreductase
MEQRLLGKTGITVSQLGFGAGNIGDPNLAESECEFLLNSVVDAGIILVDSARSYGLSEERIGKYLKSRRNEVVLSTKIGYGIPGYQDWTPQCIESGIDSALRLFQTDWIDIVHLHSCPLPVLLQEGLIDALHRAVGKGKIRVAAYSGDNEPFDWAVKSGKFGSLQTSMNICDQRVIDFLPSANLAGVGVIAKRSLANAPWRNIPRPDDQAAEEYRKRWKIMDLGLEGEQAAETALRFAGFLPGVHSCLIASTDLRHIQQNIRIVERGPLPEEVVTRIRAAFELHRGEWPGMI